MGKLALCIERIDAPVNYILSKACAVLDHGWDFWSTATRLIDRDICEKDESTLQLIPYVMLIDDGSWSLKSGPAKVFVYHRGEGGEEGRLHGKLSIGLGGHIDDSPPAGMSLMDWCAAEASRELREEVGLNVDSGCVVFANALICDPHIPVSRVHAGILAAVVTHPGALGKHEAEVVEFGSWIGLNELLAPAVFERLEPWSQAAVSYMAAGRAAGLGV